MRRGPSLGFDTLRLEAALLLPDLLENAARGQASCQRLDDYHALAQLAKQRLQHAWAVVNTVASKRKTARRTQSYDIVERVAK